jgi:hypothetical protein
MPKEMTQESELEILKHALEQSVMLQSHYASLLNKHDGGKRLQFKTADEWLARLRQLGSIPEQ